VQDARRLVLQPMPDFPDLAALNAWLEQRCIAQWERTPHGTLPGTVAEAWQAEKPALMPTPPAFDGFVEQSKRVSPTCLISFERNRYSVPASFANRPVSLRVYPARLVVAAEGRIVCEHPRVIQRSHHLLPRTIYDWRHYLAVIQRKPGALRNGAPFAELPEAFRALQHHLLKRPGGDREMVEILALVLQHDEEAVLCAVDLALRGWGADQDPRAQSAAPADRRKPYRRARDSPAHGSGADRGAQGECRALRRPARPDVGGAPCIMILRAPPSSSCCVA
jgi:hypothetical protein